MIKDAIFWCTMETNDVLSCVPTFNNFKTFITISNNLKRLIFMFGRFFIMTHGAVIFLPCGILIEFLQNKFKSIFRYVGQIK
jgi:hypothetical protein